MDINRLTQKAQEAFSQAQSIALPENIKKLMPSI